MKTNHLESISSPTFSTKLKGCLSLMKLRLSSLVVMSAFFGFVIAGGELLTYDFLWLILGGVFVTGSANGLNQVIEASSDEKMKRTQNRPLPLNILYKKEAIFFCIFTGLIGLYLLYFINFKCLLLGFSSIVLYVLAYTPLKKITWLN